MKCPKCGYNSFDYLDSCKKCNKDLTEHKARFNIQSILLSEMPTDVTSPGADEALAAAVATPDVSVDDFAGGDAGEDVDDFGFDFMGDSAEEEDLSFDELFEDVPSEEDVEETLPAPEVKIEQPATLDQELAGGETSLAPKDAAAEDFSFDEPELSSATAETADFASAASAEFGFDADEDPAADIFAESEEDFSLDSIDFEDQKKK